MTTSSLFATTSIAALIVGMLTQPISAQRYVIREVMSGLASPRGLAFGPDGGLYVTNNITSPTAGQMLSLTLVPEPSSLILVLLGVGTGGLALRQRRQIGPSEQHDQEKLP